MSTKHTPGPWEEYALSIRTVARSEQYGEGYRTEFRKRPICDVVNMRGQAEINKANATRIVACVNGCEGIADPSAVKELLAEAKWALDILTDQFGLADEDCEGVAALRAAIAKATGKPA